MNDLKPSSRKRYRLFVLSVDDLPWTNQWLGRLRCDSLLVWIAESIDTLPPIMIRAVESKASSSSDPVEPSPKHPPFEHAVEQITETLDALDQIISPDNPYQLIEDLRFGSFIEHLASIVLAKLHPTALNEESSKHVISVINDFSKRVITRDEIIIDGMVVCTQYKTATEKKMVAVEVPGSNIHKPWKIYLVRCGSREVDEVLGEGLEDFALSAHIADDLIETEQNTGIPNAEPTSENIAGKTTVDMPQINAKVVVNASKANNKEGNDLVDFGKLPLDLYLACRQRGFRVLEPDLETMDITVGPSLISIPMALEAGGSIRPIEVALEDLAREMGIQSIEVENDRARAYHIRFLIPREDRQFPNLPVQPGPLTDQDTSSYHGVYLGQDLSGNDFYSFASSWPHLLVGGTTGSGKTTFIQSLLRQYSAWPSSSADIIVIDGKGEMDYVNLLPSKHFCPQYPEVLIGNQDTTQVLEWLVESEIPRRREIMAELARTANKRPESVRSLVVRSLSSGTDEIVPFAPILVVIDEFAELMLNSSTARNFESRIQQISQIGRSSLVHLIMATQRPDASVVKGSIKANLDARVALRLPTHHDSMTILGGKGAENLLGSGDLIYQAAGQPQLRLQGYKP